MTRRIDLVMFLNEFDMLEARMRLLDSQVDAFVVIEADHTYSGKYKGHGFEQQAERFARFRHKLVYHRLTMDLGTWRWLLTHRLRPQRFAWLVEEAQRNSATQALTSFADDDLLILGDVDELPSREALAGWADHVRRHGAVACSQKMLYYRLEFQLSLGWHGSVLCTVGHVRRTGALAVRRSRDSVPALPDAGWHCSYFMSTASIREKVGSFAHQEFNRPEFVNDANIERAIERGFDLYGRPIDIERIGLDRYPQYLLDVMCDYPNFVIRAPSAREA